MPAIDVRQGLVHVLGIPIQALDDEFVRRLEEISTRETFKLSPGARLLQGTIIHETPMGDQAYTVQRIRAICAFIGAVEILGEEAYISEQHEDHRLDGKKPGGKEHGRR